jgi:hypothetical protein
MLQNLDFSILRKQSSRYFSILHRSIDLSTSDSSSTQNTREYKADDQISSADIFGTWDEMKKLNRRRERNEKKIQGVCPPRSFMHLLLPRSQSWKPLE